VIVLVKVAVVILSLSVAAHAVNPANWHPFIPGQYRHARASSAGPA